VVPYAETNSVYVHKVYVNSGITCDIPEKLCRS